jgi:hypothetical protein
MMMREQKQRERLLLLLLPRRPCSAPGGALGGVHLERSEISIGLIVGELLILPVVIIISEVFRSRQGRPQRGFGHVHGR